MQHINKGADQLRSVDAQLISNFVHTSQLLYSVDTDCSISNLQQHLIAARDKKTCLYGLLRYNPSCAATEILEEKKDKVNFAL